MTRTENSGISLSCEHLCRLWMPFEEFLPHQEEIEILPQMDSEPGDIGYLIPAVTNLVFDCTLKRLRRLVTAGDTGPVKGCAAEPIFRKHIGTFYDERRNGVYLIRGYRTHQWCIAVEGKVDFCSKFDGAYYV